MTQPYSSKVLIVEDDDFYCDSLQRYFKRNGHTVYSAGGFKVAIEAITDHEFDLIVVDLGMPDFGVDREKSEIRLHVFASIFAKSMASTHIVITGRYSADEANKCRALGARGYLSKNRLSSPRLAGILVQMANSDFVLHDGSIPPRAIEVTIPALTLDETECLRWIEDRPEFMKRKDLFALMAQHFGLKSPEMAEQKYKRARSKMIAYQNREQA